MINTKKIYIKKTQEEIEDVRYIKEILGQGEKDIREGRVMTLEELKRRLKDRWN